MKTITYKKKDGSIVTKTYDDVEYNKKYYEKHKDEIHLLKVKCDCGVEVCKTALKRHLLTNKHQKSMV